MRIIAGSLGGRTLESPNGHRTHPMSDKARGAVFNILGDLHGQLVLDAFAGSGALALEAISRGADRAMAIEVDRQAHQTIKQNIRSLGLSRHVKAIRANAGSWSDNNPDFVFDVVFCDPPYDSTQLPLVQKLVRHLDANGLLILSWPGGQTLPELPGTAQVRAKDYGDAQIGVYRKV